MDHELLERGVAEDVEQAVLASEPDGDSASEASCPTCAEKTKGLAESYVYALGRIEPRFSRLSADREFAQVVGRTDTAGKTDAQVFHNVLSRPENRYLVRQLCWVFVIQGLDTYLLYPRNPVDFDLLVAAIRPAPNPTDIDVVVGLRGPIAPPELCNGLMIPIVGFDQIYSFDREMLISAIPKPQELTVKQFRPASEEIFDRIMQLADNAGAIDGHRALNFLTMRDPTIYARAAEQYGREFSLNAVDVRSTSLTGVRNVVDVVFDYRHRQTGFTEMFSVRVDVTEEFPFLVSHLSPYYDR